MKIASGAMLSFIIVGLIGTIYGTIYGSFQRTPVEQESMDRIERIVRIEERVRFIQDNVLDLKESTNDLTLAIRELRDFHSPPTFRENYHDSIVDKYAVEIIIGILIFLTGGVGTDKYFLWKTRKSGEHKQYSSEEVKEIVERVAGNVNKTKTE